MPFQSIPYDPDTEWFAHSPKLRLVVMMTLVRSGVRFIMDHKTLDRLTALRGPGESYSNVILRMAKGGSRTAPHSYGTLSF